MTLAVGDPKDFLNGGNAFHDPIGPVLSKFDHAPFQGLPFNGIGIRGLENQVFYLIIQDHEFKDGGPAHVTGVQTFVAPLALIDPLSTKHVRR